MSALVTCTFEDMSELNRKCYCFPMEREKIEKTILGLSQHTHNSEASMKSLLSARKNYFAKTGVFLSNADMNKMQTQITAIEKTIAMQSIRQDITSRNPNATSYTQPMTKGVFMGYDFHISPDGPRLIEINSNAGGGYIVDALNRALKDGKPEIKSKTETNIIQMFQDEWAHAGRTAPLLTIAIVDENPTEQFHYPDMRLAQAMFTRSGINAVIIDPKALYIQDGALMHADERIDLVYNRLTDFSLTETKNKALRRALEIDAAVITPSPRHHELYADKQNLALLTNPNKLSALGVPKSIIKTLSAIPQTVRVMPEDAQNLWTNRRQYFFKPNAGFGSRAAYKGAKLTKKVWRHITSGGYVAQKFIAPPLRAVINGTDKLELKYDLRVYTYNGKPLFLAARMYQGQTTNLRTQGGGLAPVLISK